MDGPFDLHWLTSRRTGESSIISYVSLRGRESRSLVRRKIPSPQCNAWCRGREV